MTITARRQRQLAGTVVAKTMFTKTAIVSLVASCLAFAAHAADARKTLREPDLLIAASKNTKPLQDMHSASKAGPLSRDDVGDPESFGNHLVWLGLAQTQQVSLRKDCTGSDPAYERCITLNPQPAATSFDERKLDYLIIPGGSALSLLCQWVSPFWTYQFNNLTGVNQPNARITLTPYLTVYNDVLNDPAAIDPVTGLPYGGQMDIGMAMTHMESRSLAAGERHLQRLNYSRVCIGGIISRYNLEVMFGLPPHLADAFLQKDTTILFNLRGSAAMVDDASLFYGARIVGDQKP